VNGDVNDVDRSLNGVNDGYVSVRDAVSREAPPRGDLLVIIRRVRVCHSVRGRL